MIRPPRLILLAFTLALAACAPSGPRPSSPGALPLAPADALLPARALVHPLTRLATGADGARVLIVHVELRDRFDQSARILGRLTISVVPAGSDPADPAARRWDVDLTDPDRNALLFDDLVTRTYTVTLGGLPDWLERWAAADSSRAAAAPPLVTADFTFADSIGAVQTLHSAVRLSR